MRINLTAMIKTIIVDDEFVSRNVLKKLLDINCPDIEVICECTNAEDAKREIKQLQPQLVFLDISMPGKSGLDMLKEIPDINFEIIFVTAFHEYTIQAIRFSAIDYLLKPVDKNELVEALERVKKKIADAESHAPVQTFLHNMQTNQSQQEMQLCVPGIKGFQIIKIRDIIYCEAENTYTKIFLQDNQKLLASRPLIDYEMLLQDASFVRIHKSYLINMQHLKEYLKGEGGSVLMTNGKELEISRRKKEYFVNYMKQFFKY
jgi:two-component system, LytTR family, response regulator